MKRLPYILIAVFAFSMGAFLTAQSNPLPDTPDCGAENLARQQEVFANILTFDFESDPLTARDNLFRLAAMYQQLAINCGYEPTDQEINSLIQLTLSVTDLGTIIAANAVGEDVDVALAEVENLIGDSFNGQLLYNNIELALDGNGLGCAGCHEGEAAPPTEGVWTRIDEIRLADPALEGYTIERYLVESILHPNDYIVPDYQANLMPTGYGKRMDAQQLADVVAYLMSQDQLLDD